ncbi:hypothetical protein RHMOL_Rhmol10G0293800 [Rhododendron molle]|uniref:Uncharacterized protein n=1 Tax=Rhododendron molle TaxID=49168 RepID=A0ACC0M787_RHOML|nr:hypothetical protein RHMOL_Rhmol10G0293800 [Rhododendron molle]
MAKLFVPTLSSSLPQLLLPLHTQLTNPRFIPISSLHTSASASASRFGFPKRLVPGTQFRKSSFNRMAAMGGNVDSAPVPKSAPVEIAHELLQAGFQYLDVRTPEEFTAGHAIGAVNVPYLFKVGSGMSKNPNFLEEVSSQFGKDDKIIVGCLSGKRSLMAATDMMSAGFTEVTDIVGGYAAWTQNGLPTES